MAGELKATPGPWDVDTGFEVLGADGSFVATSLCDDALVYHLEDECIANACLIATSPELYDALDYAHTVLTSVSDALGKKSKAVEAAIQKAAAALRKARGEQP